MNEYQKHHVETLKKMDEILLEPKNTQFIWNNLFMNRDQFEFFRDVHAKFAGLETLYYDVKLENRKPRGVN